MIFLAFYNIQHNIMKVNILVEIDESKHKDNDNGADESLARNLKISLASWFLCEHSSLGWAILLSTGIYLCHR